MIGYINKINDNEWKPCNREKFYKIIESKKVERQTEVVRRTGNKAEKDKLPAFIFSGELMAEEYSKYVEEAKAQGIAKKDMKGSRSNQFMKPTGLFIMDFDRDDDQTYQLYDKFKQVMTDNGIELKGFMAAAHRTARGFGLRLVLRRREGMSIFDDQQWIAGLMGEKIDENCKDLARSSFAVPKKDFLYIDEEMLFGEHPLAPMQIAKLSDNEIAATSTVPAAEAPIATEATAEDANSPANPAAESFGTAERVNLPLLPATISSKSNGQTMQSKAASSTFEKNYDGIPYPVLVESLAEQLGGVPAHGSRNSFLFSMACHLRYVCGDSAEWIKQVLPTYGEDTDKAHRTIESACNRNQAIYMPAVVKRAIRMARQRMQLHQTSHADSMEDTPPPMPADSELPPLIRLLTSRVPALFKPCVAHAVFPALGTHLGNVQFRYIDNVLRQATFMCVLMARMSVGKSCVNTPIDYLLADIEERDKESRRREREWSEEVSRKGANKEKPKRPDDLCIQLVQSDMTNAAFVRRLEDANGNFIYTRMDEVELLDQLKTNNKGQQVSQILRLAFDCGWYGQERVGPQSVTGRVRVKWNWNASSTIQKGKRYFRNALADGTLSRLNFCTIMADTDSDIPVIGTYDNSFAAELKPYIDNLNGASGIITCPEAEELARQLMVENRDIANLSDDEAYRSLSYRANVIAYLKAMTLYVAQGCQWSDEIEQFIRWSEQYDLWCKIKFFGELMDEQMVGENIVTTRGPMNLLNLLPNRFSKMEAMEVKRRNGKNDNVESMLKNWIKRNYIFIDHTTGEYVKTEKFMQRVS